MPQYFVQLFPYAAVAATEFVMPFAQAALHAPLEWRQSCLSHPLCVGFVRGKRDQTDRSDTAERRNGTRCDSRQYEHAHDNPPLK
jgi:hypothetical protein